MVFFPQGTSPHFSMGERQFLLRTCFAARKASYVYEYIDQERPHVIGLVVYFFIPEIRLLIVFTSFKIGLNQWLGSHHNSQQLQPQRWNDHDEGVGRQESS